MKDLLQTSNMLRRAANARLDKVLGKTECVTTETPPTRKVAKAVEAKTARQLVPSNA